MTDDSRLDERLHDLARASLDRHAATVDVDAAFAALTARLDGIDTVPVVARPRRRVWLGLVAAALVVGAAGVVVAIARRDGKGPSTVTVATPSTTAPATTTSTSPAVASTTVTTTVPTTAAPPLLAATAEPATVAAGSAVTITPGGTVERACTDIVTIRSADGLQVVGQLDRDGWRPAPADGSPVTYPACRGTITASAVTFVVPADLAAGDYTACLTGGSGIEGCAPLTVSAAVPATAPVNGLARLDVPIFGIRADSPYPALIVDELAPDGRRIREAAEIDEATQRRPRSSVLPDGSVISLREQPEFQRCVNHPIVHTVDGAVVAPPADLGFARSVTATANGLLVATRDVCPDGTTWGDPGTSWELVALDLTDPTASVEVLQTRLPDPSLVWYDHDGYVMTAGEPRIAEAGPDGRHVAFVDVFHPDRVGWLLLDLAAPAAMAPLPSSCPLPGDIASPPRFVGGLVVVARRCATLVSDGEPFPQMAIGAAILHVDAVDLTTGEVVWHSAAAAVGPNSYSYAAGLSARLADDGTVWVLLGADGGTEQRGRWFVLHGDDVAEITRDDYDSFAFAPSELAGA